MSIRRKQLAAESAKELSEIKKLRLKNVYQTFLLNPSAANYQSLMEAATNFQEARNVEHSIAEWPDDE